jgi:RNA methyltransferase, TrmH family
MPTPERLTSLQNPRVKELLGLRDRRDRDARGLTLIEEPRVIRRARRAGYPFLEVWYCPELLDAVDPELLAFLRAGEPFAAVEVNPPVMAKIAYKEKPEGVLVVAPQRRLALDRLVLPETPLLLVIEAVEKPGNLGAILRVADGAGVDAVIVCDPGTDIFNPNVLRASTGAFFTVPVVEEDASRVRSWLRERRIRGVATTPAAALAYTDADLRGPVAILLGAEDRGLSAEWLMRADLQARIPMRGESDSLNVSVTAALMAYEAVRQRRLPPGTDRAG